MDLSTLIFGFCLMAVSLAETTTATMTTENNTVSESWENVTMTSSRMHDSDLVTESSENASAPSMTNDPNLVTESSENASAPSMTNDPNLVTESSENASAPTNDPSCSILAASALWIGTAFITHLMQI